MAPRLGGQSGSSHLKHSNHNDLSNLIGGPPLLLYGAVKTIEHPSACLFCTRPTKNLQVKLIQHPFMVKKAG